MSPTVVAQSDSICIEGQILLKLDDDYTSDRLVLVNAVSVVSTRKLLPYAQQTRFELRKQLLDNEWDYATVDEPADVLTKRLMPHRPSKYFQCLLHPHIVYVPGFRIEIQIEWASNQRGS